MESQVARLLVAGLDNEFTWRVLGGLLERKSGETLEEIIQRIKGADDSGKASSDEHQGQQGQKSDIYNGLTPNEKMMLQAFEAQSQTNAESVRM